MKPSFSDLCVSVSLWFHRLGRLFLRGHLDADMAAEMRAHLDAQTQRNLAAGMSPDDARAAAHRQFGGVAQIQERARDQSQFAWFEHLVRDLRGAGRQVRKNPGFSSVVVVTLALAIGGNTAIFTVVNALMLRPLPVPEPERLVIIDGAGTYARFDQLRHEVQTLSGVLAVGHIRPHRLAAPALGIREIETATVQEVSGNFFAVLEQPALLGRTLVAEDDRTGDPRPVVVLSHAFWQRRLNGDPDVIGQTVLLNNVAVAIVGVMPDGFFGVDVARGPAVDLWCPLWLKTRLAAGFDAQRLTTAAINSSWLTVMGRLHLSATLEHAQAELDVVSERLRAQRPGDRVLPMQVRPGSTGHTWWRGEFRQTLNVLGSVAAIVLLVACANVGGLLLARGSTRQREFAVRLALGAGRGRLVRQLVAESLLLALLGGTVGLFFAMWGVNALSGYMTETALDLRLDPHVLRFNTLVAVGAGFLFGLAPALRFSRTSLATAFHLHGGTIAGGSRQRLNRALVVAQIALSFVLLAGAGFFVRTLQNLRAHDPGFARDNVLQFTLGLGRGPTPAQRDDLQRRVLDALDVLPGVRSATISHGGMLAGFNSWTGFSVEGEPAAQPRALTIVPGLAAPERSAVLLAGGRRYFETKGIALLSGRDFATQDEQSSAPRVAIIGESIADSYFPAADPIGQSIRLDSGENYRIIGVARETQVRPAWDPMRDPAIYLSFFQKRDRELNEAEFTLRTSLDPRSLGPDLRAAVSAIAPEAEIVRLNTVAAMMDHGLARQRAMAELAGFFSVLTLTLAALGLYGMLAYTVTQRTREIGVRRALGAQLHEVIRLIIGQGAKLVMIGCALGTFGAIALTQMIRSLLHGVSPTDPVIFAVVFAVMLIVALIACWLPARRAAKVDPMVALRTE